MLSSPKPKPTYALPKDLYGFDPRNAKSIETKELALFLEAEVIPHVQRATRIDERLRIVEERMAKYRGRVQDMSPYDTSPAMDKALKKIDELENEKLMLLQEQTTLTREPQEPKEVDYEQYIEVPCGIDDEDSDTNVAEEMTVVGILEQNSPVKAPLETAPQDKEAE